MIPHIIHYCWFGRNPKPPIVIKCIESWKRYMPEYEIREWNEENYDINKCIFAKEAYESGKWAFVSDYVRFDVINSYGGIYMDTDVELLRSIPENVLNNIAFTGFESAGKVNPGLIYAAPSGFEFTQKILDRYNQLRFIVDNEIKLVTVNEVVTELLTPFGLRLNNQMQTIEGLTIYPSSVFCGYDMDVHEIDIKKDTISVHHYAGTWVPKSSKKKLTMYLKKVLGVNGYRYVLACYRKIKSWRMK